LRILEIILEIRVRIVKEEESVWEDARLERRLFFVRRLIINDGFDNIGATDKNIFINQRIIHVHAFNSIDDVYSYLSHYLYLSGNALKLLSYIISVSQNNHKIALSRKDALIKCNFSKETYRKSFHELCDNGCLINIDNNEWRLTNE